MPRSFARYIVLYDGGLANLPPDVHSDSDAIAWKDANTDLGIKRISRVTRDHNGNAVDTPIYST